MMNQDFAEGLYHLSYGMVDLPTGKMKSREGTVVDADDLMADVIEQAKQSAEVRGSMQEVSDDERNDIYRKVGMAALKYFIIRVNPRKRMTFRPDEALDMQGTTGPYIQNAYVRIQSIIRRYGKSLPENIIAMDEWGAPERQLLNLMVGYKSVIRDAMKDYDPS
ncbi:unnamed protein product, partial [Cyprideis torosa]